MKKLFAIWPLILALALAPTPLLIQGCSTTQQRQAYNTIYSLERAAMAAYDSYMTGVIRGEIRTNDVPQVSKSFNVFQASMLVALDAAEFNRNAEAPASLSNQAADLLFLIKTVTDLSKKP